MKAHFFTGLHGKSRLCNDGQGQNQIPHQVRDDSVFSVSNNKKILRGTNEK